MAGHAYNLLDSYIYGFAIQEVRLQPGTSEEQHRAAEALLEQLPADDYPSMALVARDFLASGADYAAEFGFGLDLILDGIERVSARPRRQRGTNSAPGLA
jgi:hypothetical protein